MVKILVNIWKTIYLNWGERNDIIWWSVLIVNTVPREHKGFATNLWRILWIKKIYEPWQETIMTLSKDYKEFGTLLLLVTNINLVTLSPKNFLRHLSWGLVQTKQAHGSKSTFKKNSLTKTEKKGFVIGFVCSFKIKADCLLQLAHISRKSLQFITFVGGVLP